jgi:hypothetical protein
MKNLAEGMGSLSENNVTFSLRDHAVNTIFFFFLIQQQKYSHSIAHHEPSLDKQIERAPLHKQGRVL